MSRNRAVTRRFSYVPNFSPPSFLALFMCLPFSYHSRHLNYFPSVNVVLFNIHLGVEPRRGMAPNIPIFLFNFPRGCRCMDVAAVHLPPFPFVCCWLLVSFPDLEPPSLVYFAMQKSACLIFCAVFILNNVYQLKVVSPKVVH